jgi:hypothetical protein
LSSKQYQIAVEKGEAYWLYIVERARSPQPKVTPIQNPVGRITEYRFDSSWATLASQSTKRSPAETEDRDTLVDELKTYTTNEVCKGVIDACYRKDLVLPEVGYEFADEDGVVLGEVELAWPDHRTAVVLTEQVPGNEEWRIFSVEEIPEDDSEFELYGLLTSAEPELEIETGSDDPSLNRQ